MKRFWKILGIIVLAVAVILLIAPLLYPVAPLTGTVPERELADPDSRFVEVNGVTVHYKERGQGEPVFILLHGFGASEFSWREVMEPLSRSGRVIAYDRPAFGLTERPLDGNWTGTNPYSVQGNVELLDGLMNELGVDKAILVGNSAGGEVAAAYALEHPERVQGLVLVDPAVGKGNRGPFSQWAVSLMASPQIRHIAPLLVRTIAGDMGNDTIRMAWHDPSRIEPEVYEGYRRPLKADNWDKALYEFTIAGNPVDNSERLADLKIPVLVVTGDDDRIVPTVQSIQLSREIPGAELASIERLRACPSGGMPGPIPVVNAGFS